MQPDLATLILATTVVSFALAFSVLLVDAQTRGRDGLAFWGWSQLVVGLVATVLVVQFDRAGLVTSIGATLFITVALSLQLHAVMQFQRGRAAAPPVWLVWAPAILGVALAALFTSWAQMRYFWLGQVYAFQLALLAWFAWGQRLQGPREKSRVLLVGGSLALALFFVGRSVVVILEPDTAFSRGVPPSLAAWSLFAGLAACLVNTVGFLLMQKERAVELYRDQSTLDALTGVSNRRSLLQLTDNTIALANRQSTPVAMLMLDIDNFRRVNDTYGQLAGDAVLREVGRRVRQRLRRQDIVGRYGGEEFMVLLAADVNGALVVANQIREAISEKPVDFGGRKIPVSLSIGVHARVPDSVDGATDRMIEAADRALYNAKVRGRNRVEVSD